MPANSLEQVRNLCMRRGFVFPGSAVYGGVASFWDYGPLGVELLNNIKKAWWQDTIYTRNDMEGLDAAVLMSRKVWQHSGHEATFSDPLVDCKACRSRFRADDLVGAWIGKVRQEDVRRADTWLRHFQAHERVCAAMPEPLRTAGVQIMQEIQAAHEIWWPLGRLFLKFKDAGDEAAARKMVDDEDARRANQRMKSAQEAHKQFIEQNATAFEFACFKAKEIECPKCGSKEFTEPRNFNLMFQSHVGPVAADKGTDEEKAARVYLRPETAQGIFMNFAHVQRAMARKIPFGVAQIGKAFRNEITPGNFIFRTREFEQMEIEFFIKPPQFVKEGEKNDQQWHEEWVEQRFNWWLRYATSPSATLEDRDATAARFRARAQTPDELAHYAKATTDIEYLFPGSLGWGEIEGVANRTDFDLTAHSNDIPEEDLKRLKLEPNKDSTVKLDYFDPDAKARYIPWVIEPSAGATRAMLTFLCEAYHDEVVTEPTKQQIDQIKSDAAMIRKNAEKKIKEAQKEIAAGREAKHDPAKVEAFLNVLDETVARLPASLTELLTALDHEGAQNLEPVKKFRPPTEKLVEDCTRTVLRLHPALAPVKLAVFPLKKNKPELVELAQAIKERFQRHFRVVYDDSAGIGRLYRRQDEIGTPFCITVDFESLEDGTVTVRERDSMEQERVKIDDLPSYLLPRLQGE
ncbi:MAG: Proline--tRNA ligase [Planctomycetes bacterium]|nr:Proline--tRNA ligase [Planctomycetota bacterium]